MSKLKSVSNIKSEYTKNKMKNKVMEKLKNKTINQLILDERNFHHSDDMKLKKEQIEESKEILIQYIVPFNFEINCWEDSCPSTYTLEEKEIPEIIPSQDKKSKKRKSNAEEENKLLKEEIKRLMKKKNMELKKTN